jgi:hypothetical protein
MDPMVHRGLKESKADKVPMDPMVHRGLKESKADKVPMEQVLVKESKAFRESKADKVPMDPMVHRGLKESKADKVPMEPTEPMVHRGLKESKADKVPMEPTDPMVRREPKVFRESKADRVQSALQAQHLISAGLHHQDLQQATSSLGRESRVQDNGQQFAKMIFHSPCHTWEERQTLVQWCDGMARLTHILRE